MHAPEQLPSPELSTQQTELIAKAGLLTESNIVHRERPHYGHRKLTPRERVGYYLGRLAGTRDKASAEEGPDALVQWGALQKVNKQTDHSSVWIGQSPEGYDRNLEVYTITDFDAGGEQKTTINIVDTREATNPHAASDWSAHITETVRTINLLEPLDPEEILQLDKQFDSALERAKTVQQ